jgi:hypothetical protein
MECFLVKVDVFMEWECQPTGIVEFLRLNSTKVLEWIWVSME